MKAPKNFYNTVDQSKLGIDDLFTRTAENEADIAAIEEVIENLPEITPVEANPDEPITGILNSVKIGNTNYRVRDDAKITTIKKLNILLTGSSDGYNIALGKVVIYNSITGEYYTFIDGTDTIACDKPYHDSNINNCLYGYPGTDCRVYKNQGAPTFTITFGNDLNIERYDTLAIYSTNPVSMCANNVKVAISPDGESFVDTIDKNMTWINSTATPNVIGNIYEITDPVIDAIVSKIGTIETEIDGHLLADVTSSDEGKIMSVNASGAWALTTPAGSNNVDYELRLQHSGGGTSDWGFADVTKHGNDVINDVLAGKNVRLIEKSNNSIKVLGTLASADAQTAQFLGLSIIGANSLVISNFIVEYGMSVITSTDITK